MNLDAITCLSHTDAERAAWPIRCPVCAGKATMRQHAAADSAIMKRDKRITELEADLYKLQRFVETMTALLEQVPHLEHNDP